MSILFSYIGWLAWVLLILTMLTRPLSMLFKGVFLKILPYRKWLGISLSLAIIVHVIIFSSNRGFDFSYFINPGFWNFSNLFGWGLLGFVVMIPLFITSNKFSIKLLGKNWKRLQRLAYLLFVSVGIHIYFANWLWYFSLLPIGIWALLYVIALFKQRK